MATFYTVGKKYQKDGELFDLSAVIVENDDGSGISPEDVNEALEGLSGLAEMMGAKPVSDSAPAQSQNRPSSGGSPFGGGSNRPGGGQTQGRPGGTTSGRPGGASGSRPQGGQNQKDQGNLKTVEASMVRLKVVFSQKKNQEYIVADWFVKPYQLRDGKWGGLKAVASQFLASSKDQEAFERMTGVSLDEAQYGEANVSRYQSENGELLDCDYVLRTPVKITYLEERKDSGQGYEYKEGKFKGYAYND